ncbi:hypothetical protein [Hymenobacter jejuensis]|uniref:Uncharacterized protein n=1 Tax=Hymenobacter jejuensis TaxID=2502781 RepID=A0A5B8A248_9BACT|nr:hypothetical protein [Hymenobacter jejuensis]QDA61219.1 hypothetical protein FHG12_14420 [Hymenobacter jejuensis]
MNSYFILWPTDWCKRLAQAHDQGPLQAIYGGSHTSVPPLGRVTVGDIIHPVSIKNGQLFIIGRMRVTSILDAEEYLKGQNISRFNNELWDTSAHKLLKQNPELGHRIPRSCIENVALGTGTGLRFDFNLSTEIVSNLRFGQKPGFEKRLSINEEGKISHVGLQGHFRRLSSDSAALVAEVMREF